MEQEDNLTKNGGQQSVPIYQTENGVKHEILFTVEKSTTSESEEISFPIKSVVGIEDIEVENICNKRPNSSDETNYEIEKIVDEKLLNNKRIYRVRWKGYTCK